MNFHEEPGEGGEKHDPRSNRRGAAVGAGMEAKARVNGWPVN
jgi:hypothetical protein